MRTHSNDVIATAMIFRKLAPRTKSILNCTPQHNGENFSVAEFDLPIGAGIPAAPL
jgi:hypothetical protein